MVILIRLVELREARLGCYMSVLYVCLNSMLFGVEIWDLNDRDLQALESAHLQVARMIQCLLQNVVKTCAY